MNTSIRDQIIDLSGKWYEYVTIQHHKDRDCHWYIDVDYAYGQEPKYTANHFGYVFHEIHEQLARDNLEQAEGDLLALIKTAIAEEAKWVDEVLKDKSQWDDDQIAQAEAYAKIFGGK